MRTIFRIVCQTFACIGFGTNIVFTFMFKMEGGPEMVARMFEVSHPPYMWVMLTTILCFMGTVVLTFGNASELTEKKKEVKS